MEITTDIDAAVARYMELGLTREQACRRVLDMALAAAADLWASAQVAR